MSSKQVQTNSSEEGLKLPEPDPENITVLTDNLPNKPILPWNRYDSPWNDAHAEEPEQSETIQEIDEQEEVVDVAESAVTEELGALETEQEADELEEEPLIAATEDASTQELEQLEEEPLIVATEDASTQELEQLEEEPLIVATEDASTQELESLETIPQEAEEPKKEVLVEQVQEDLETLTDELKQLG